MDAETRLHLDRVQRVMRPSDTSKYAARPPAQRAAADRAFWLAADPLWSRASNDAHTEFLARVAYAELRWSLPEGPTHGADTERGSIHVRYGPPGFIAGGDLVWAYNSGQVFAFDRADNAGVSDLNRPYSTNLIVQATPATWGNGSVIDNMLLNVARFRANDSVDVYATLNAPRAQTPRGGDGHVPGAHLWTISNDTLIRSHDSLRVTDTMPVAISRRVAPGKYAVRAEISSEGDAATGALGLVSVVAMNDTATGFTLRGFGLSDLVFASRVASRAGATARWRDFDITPHVGAVSGGKTIEVLWETYDLEARDGSASYDVALTVAQADTRTGIRRIAAEVVGALGSVVGVDRKDNSITSRFTRTASASRVVTDHVTVGLGDTPSGVYTMTLDVTDKATGRKATKTRTLVVK